MALPGLFTIGYEGRTLEQYLGVLERAQVSLLCDVRRNPVSRKPGFGRKVLAAACAARGMRYEHLPQLGIDAAQRHAATNGAAIEAMFERYAREYLPLQSAALLTIAAWLREGERVALTCFEADAQQCHRHLVAQALERELRLRAEHL